MARERGLDSLDVRAMPLPIANAVAELEAALNPHEERDRLVEVFRAILRCLGGFALAARLEVGPGPKRPSAEVDERLSRLRRQALTDGEWVGLTRELLRPWRDVAGTHPLPVLVDVFVGKRARIHEGLDGLLGMRKRETVAHGTTGTESEAKAIVAERMPLLVELLEGLSPLWSEARTVVPLERPSDGSSTRQRAWLLHGPTPPRGRWRVVDLAEGERAAPGRPVVVDPVGKVRLSLEPAVLCERASPEMPEDLFFLDGRDKKTAVFTAFPSMAEVRRKDVLEALDRALSTTSSEGGQPSENEAKAPFKGLESFGPEDASFFVGREQLVEELTNRILANPWVTVTGASGSGKTSLLAAGVGPALRARVEREREATGYRGATTEYAVVMLRPGSDPMVALANKLDGELGLDLDLDDRSGWAKSMLDWCAARRRVLVLMVDQAEELVTLCRDAERREAFGALLSELTGRSETPVRVVLSLRVDFMAQVATIRSIGDRYQRATQVVTTPQREDLVRILVEPAARLGVKWEAGLAEEMADAVKDGSSALPLVSFVASEMWKRRGEDGVLDRAAYDALGGVGGALGAHADRVVASLTEAQRILVRSVFLRLVTAEGTRDVVARSELEEAAAPDGNFVVSKLLDERLLASRELSDGHTMIELAHEALLAHWPQLGTWRGEDVEAEVHHARLRAAVREWTARGRPMQRLWGNDALVEHRAVKLRRGDALSLTEDERAFISASSQAVQRHRRLILGLTITIISVLAVFVIFAVVQWRNAEAARNVAERERRHAAELENAARAQANLSFEKTLVALARRFRAEEHPAEELAVLRALADPALERDGSQVAVANGLLELANGPTARVVPISGEIVDVAGDHALVAEDWDLESSPYTGAVRVIDARDGSDLVLDPSRLPWLPPDLPATRGSVPELSPAGRFARVQYFLPRTTSNGERRLWLHQAMIELSTQTLVRDFGECVWLDADFAPDDSSFAWGCRSTHGGGSEIGVYLSDGTVRVLSTTCTDPVAWDGAQEHLTALCDGSPTLFDARTGEAIRRMQAAPGRQHLVPDEAEMVLVGDRRLRGDALLWVDSAWLLAWRLSDGSLFASLELAPEHREGALPVPRSGSSIPRIRVGQADVRDGVQGFLGRHRIALNGSLAAVVEVEPPNAARTLRLVDYWTRRVVASRSVPYPARVRSVPGTIVVDEIGSTRAPVRTAPMDAVLFSGRASRPVIDRQYVYFWTDPKQSTVSTPSESAASLYLDVDNPPVGIAPSRRHVAYCSWSSERGDWCHLIDSTGAVRWSSEAGGCGGSAEVRPLVVGEHWVSYGRCDASACLFNVETGERRIPERPDNSTCWFAPDSIVEVTGRSNSPALRVVELPDGTERLRLEARTSDVLDAPELGPLEIRWDERCVRLADGTVREAQNPALCAVRHARGFGPTGFEFSNAGPFGVAEAVNLLTGTRTTLATGRGFVEEMPEDLSYFAVYANLGIGGPHAVVDASGNVVLQAFDGQPYSLVFPGFPLALVPNLDEALALRPIVLDARAAFLQTGERTNLRVCRDSLEVVPVVPYPAPDTAWAPLQFCTPTATAPRPEQ